MVQGQETKVTSAYQDEEEKIDTEAKQRVELALRIGALLDDYGYDVVAKLVDGVPQVQFSKRQ